MERFARIMKKHWWLVVLGALGGVAVAYTSGTRVDVYQARALVVAIAPTVDETEVGGVLRSIFSTDAVLTPTRDHLALDTSPRQLVSSGSLTVEAGASDLAVNIVARARD